MVARAGIIGATAFLVPNHGVGFGEDAPITIAAFGDVPPEARDALQF